MKKWMAALFALLLLAGCQAPTPVSSPTPSPTVSPTPVAEPTSSPAPTQTPEPKAPSSVYTDWSKLTPYEPQTPLYTLHPGYHPQGLLEPREDYGALLPYIGKYSTMEQYVIDSLPFWGLVTDKGELVCDPVYTWISFFEDFLLLSRASPANFDLEDPYAGNGYSRVLAAVDGSWICELGSRSYLAGGHGLILLSDSDGSLELWNKNGEQVVRFDAGLFASRLGEAPDWDGEGGAWVDLFDDRVGYVTSYVVNGVYQEEPVLLYLDLLTGAVLDSPPPGYDAEIDYSGFEEPPTPPETKGGYSLSPIRDLVTGEVYFEGYYRSHPEDESVSALFDGEGRLLATDCDLIRFEQSMILRGGLYAIVEDGFFCFRSLRDNSLVFRYPMGTNSD